MRDVVEDHEKMIGFEFFFSPNHYGLGFAVFRYKFRHDVEVWEF
jgi:hypothetical protein